MAESQDFSLDFPVGGVDISVEYGRRPTGTTEDGENVRAFDTLADRARGGSRPGTSKLVNEKVNGDNEVQHLTVLVDPTTPGLNAEVDDGDYLDPSTNNLRTRNFGRYVRTGGSGRQPNRNSPNIAFVQQKRVQPGNISAVTTVTLDAQPAFNSLIIVVVRTSNSTIAESLVSSVTNADLNAFTQVGGSGYTSAVTSTVPGTTTNSLSVWYRIADAGVDDQTIRVTPGSLAIYEIAVFEYKNADVENPLNDFERNSDTGSVSSWAGGEITPNGTSGQLIFAVYTKINTAVTKTTGYNYRMGNTTLGATEAANMAIEDRLNVSGQVPENPTVTVSPSKEFASIVAAFTR